MSDQVWTDLQAQYHEPDWELVDVVIRAGRFVLRNPTPAEYKRFMTEARGEDTRGVATANLFASTCVFPDQAGREAALKRFPGLLTNKRIQGALAYLSGSADELEGKG
jgi:hypothetical protein